VDPARNICQRHQVLPIGADVDRVIVDCVLIAGNAPLQGISGNGRGKRQTIVDAGFDLGGFFIIIPGHQLQIWQLTARIVKAINFGESLQPGLAALLPHDTA
jgi:hypothetical protein